MILAGSGKFWVVLAKCLFLGLDSLYENGWNGWKVIISSSWGPARPGSSIMLIN
jgi:hypothetical protein